MNNFQNSNLPFLKFFESRYCENARQGKPYYSCILLSTLVCTWKDVRRPPLHPLSLCLAVDAKARFQHRLSSGSLFDLWSPIPSSVSTLHQPSHSCHPTITQIIPSRNNLSPSLHASDLLSRSLFKRHSVYDTATIPFSLYSLSLLYSSLQHLLLLNFCVFVYRLFSPSNISSLRAGTAVSPVCIPRLHHVSVDSASACVPTLSDRKELLPCV